jgi:hypothetical protein
LAIRQQKPNRELFLDQFSSIHSSIHPSPGSGSLSLPPPCSACFSSFAYALPAATVFVGGRCPHALCLHVVLSVTDRVFLFFSALPVSNSMCHHSHSSLSCVPFAGFPFRDLLWLLLLFLLLLLRVLHLFFFF